MTRPAPTHWQEPTNPRPTLSRLVRGSSTLQGATNGPASLWRVRKVDEAGQLRPRRGAMPIHDCHIGKVRCVPSESRRSCPPRCTCAPMRTTARFGESASRASGVCCEIPCQRICCGERRIQRHAVHQPRRTAADSLVSTSPLPWNSTSCMLGRPAVQMHEASSPMHDTRTGG